RRRMVCVCAHAHTPLAHRVRVSDAESARSPDHAREHSAAVVARGWFACSRTARRRQAAGALRARRARRYTCGPSLDGRSAARHPLPARALVNSPRVVPADEPTGSLDSANTAVVLDALAEVTASGAALIVATHDPAVAARGRQVAMRDGRLGAPARDMPATQ